MKTNIFKILFCFIFTILLSVFISGCDKKSTKPEAVDMVTISPDGGEYTFPDGILLRVPPGAVSQDTDIRLRKLNAGLLSSIFDTRGVSLDNLLACIEGTPDGTQFIYPVQLCISVDLEPGDIPFVHEIDLASGDYTPAETEIICDADQDSLFISLSHFSIVSAEIIQEYKQLYKDCGDNPCRCLRIKVEQHDKDYICDNGDCQISESNVSVTFLDCPGMPVEKSVIREVSAACTPNLVLSAANTTVSINGQTSLTARVELGCEPTEGQSVDFSVTELASVNPASGASNASGEAVSTFTAGGEEGTATVTATTTASYHTSHIYASAGGADTTINGPLKTQDLTASVDIEIVGQNWSGTMTYDRFCEANIWIHENASYSVDFSFTISSRGDIIGTATTTQTASVTAIVPGWCFQNINVPPTVDLEVSGQGPDPFYLVMERPYPRPPFYTWEDYCCAPECTNPDINYGVGTTQLGIGLIDDEPILSEGTFTGEYDVIGLEWITYTITLHRDDP